MTISIHHSKEQKTKEQKTNNLTKSIGAVPAKDSPKIMLVIEKSLKAFVVRELGNFCVPGRG